MADTHSGDAQRKPSRADDIATMAAVLSDQYGADAVHVARRQIEGSVQNESGATWREILAHLLSD